MSHQTEYDLRMRSYKSITDAHLIPRTPVIIQIDGRAFHTFTRGFKKPFDQVLMAAIEASFWTRLSNHGEVSSFS